MNQGSAEQRVSCPRHHWLFSVMPEGIAIKCRAGECRQVHVIPWVLLDAKRQEVEKCAILPEKQEIVR